MQCTMTAKMESPGLSSAQMESYLRDGYFAGFPVLTDEETQVYRQALLDYLARIDWNLNVFTRHKPHLFLKWANDLGRHPRLIQAVEQILGPDVLLWYSVVFVKPAQSGEYVAWHQDSHYWAMKEEKGLTAWVALSEVSQKNGGMKMIPGSHLGADVQHVVAPDDTDNLLHRGQKIVGLDEKISAPVDLKAGQASFHDLRTLHSSGPNRSQQPRLGIAFRYIPATNHPQTLRWLKRSATLVAGRYDFRNFIEDPRPATDHDGVGIAAHKRSVRVAALHSLFGDKSRSGIRKMLDSVRIMLSRRSQTAASYLKKLRD